MGEDEDKVISGDITLTPAENPSDAVQGYEVIEPCTATTYIGYGDDGYLLVDVNEGPLTQTGYVRMYARDGWIVAEDMDTGLRGVLSMNGEEIIPFKYTDIDMAAKGSLIIAYCPEDVTFTLYYIDGDTCTSAVFSPGEVGSPTVLDADHILITHPQTGKSVLYDKNFNIVDTIATQEIDKLLYGYDEEYKITENAERIMSESDALKAWKTMIENGYVPTVFYGERLDYVSVKRINGDSDLLGVADKNGELIVPIEYDRIIPDGGYESSGYFLVVKDGKAGYIRKDGQVTVAPNTYIYSSDEAAVDTSEGIVSSGQLGFIYREADGSYTLVAADGTITTGFSEKPQNVVIRFRGNATGGLCLWKITGENGSESLIDWHGNVVYEATNGIGDEIRVSANRKYLFFKDAQTSYEPLLLNSPVNFE